MKKYILTIASLIAFNASLSAQIFDRVDEEVVEDGFEWEADFFGGVSEESNPGFNGGGIQEIDEEPVAPINDYIPFLLIGAAGLAVYYRKQILVKN